MAPTSFKRIGLVLAALVCLSAASSTAFAAPQGSAGPTCDQAGAAQPFRPWLDPLSYVLAPNGALEGGGAGWTLSGGAKVVTGNEPFAVHGKSDSHSLLLPAGSSATTGRMCIGLLHPTVRFFTIASKGVLSLSTLKVQVLVYGTLGNLLSTVDGTVVPATARWAPTLPLPLLVNFTAPAGTDSIAFRLTPQGGPLGSTTQWQVDDIYVDPWAWR